MAAWCYNEKNLVMWWSHAHKRMLDKLSHAYKQVANEATPWDIT